MAPNDAAALAAIFRQEARQKLRQNARAAVQEAGGSDELANFLHGLQPPEREVLIRTWDKMQELGLTGQADGATVSFL